MRLTTTVFLFAAFLFAGSASAQTEYVLNVPVTGNLEDGYSTNHSGARDVSGPHDLDGDGAYEVLVADYTAGGRVHVIENAGPDTWELVYSTPVLDSTATTNNIRAIGAGDTDGDGMGEIIFFSGRNFADTTAVGIYFFEHTGNDNDYGDAPAVVFDMGENQLDRWRQEQIEVVDVDGDGLDEVLWANNGGAGDDDRWVVNGVSGDIGSGFEVLVFELQLTSRVDGLGIDPVNRGGGSPYGIVPADLDGDGNWDIAMQSWNNYNFTNGTVTGTDSYSAPDSNAANAFLQAKDADHVAFFGCVAVDIDQNGDDEVACPTLQDGGLSILNYEEGESVLEVTAENVAINVVEGFSTLGITAGDVDGDGMPEIIGSGASYTAVSYEAGNGPEWIRIVDYIGPTGEDASADDVENPANYSMRVPDLGLETDSMAFDLVMRDSAGVMSMYYEDGAQGPEFVAKLAYLGDADMDGMSELAVSMQGVDDSLFVYDEVWSDADTAYVRTVNPTCGGKAGDVACAVNENRFFLRIFSGGAIGVAVEEDRIVLPSEYKLSGNYPNPFNPTTTFDFTLPLEKQVSVKVYDMAGRLVKTLVDNEVRSAGTHTISWDATDAGGLKVASGNYIYTLEYGNFRQTRTMVLLK